MNYKMGGIYMFSPDNQTASLFFWDLLRQNFLGEQAAIFKYNALTTILINNNIPFDTVFKNATRRDAASIQLTIYVNPSMNIVLNIAISPADTR